MKVFRDSIYFFGVFSLISIFVSAYLCDISVFYSNVMLGIFGSSLITMFSSMVFYFNEKEKIIVSLGLKCASLYGTLNYFLAYILNGKDISTKELSVKLVSDFFNKYSDIIKQNSIRNELSNFSSVLGNDLFCKIYANQEIKIISSLWTMEANLINQLPTILHTLDCIQIQYDIACLENNEIVKQQKTEEILYILTDMKNTIPKQIEFIDQIMIFLYKYKKFNSTWNELKEQLGKSNNISFSQNK